MNRGIRNCLFAILAIGLLAGVLSSNAAGADKPAKASVVDCSKLKGPNVAKCKAEQCDTPAGDNKPICDKYKHALLLDPGKKENARCGDGSTPATVGGQSKCLRAGQKCKKKYKDDYKAAGFKCKAKTVKGKRVRKLKKA